MTKSARIVLPLLVLLAAGLAQADWHVETVVSTDGVGSHTSLALDALGYPHVAYNRTSPVWNWEYAYWDGSAWQVETVTTEGSEPSLGLDASGYAHVSYTFWDGMDQSILYAYQDSGGWNIETVDSGFVGMEAPLVMDGSGRPHLAYQGDDGTTAIIHAVRDTGVWTLDSALNPPYVEQSMDLALDPAGYARIIHVTTMGSHYMDLAVEGSSGWTLESVDGKQSTMDYAILVDAAGYTHVAYPDEAAPNLAYSYEDVSGWNHEVVDTDGGSWVDLAFDAAGEPHISYAGYGMGGSDLRHAWRDGGIWYTEIVDPGPGVGRDSSIAIDDQGYVHISYHDELAGDLKYARQLPPVPATGPLGLILLVALGTLGLARRKR